jgi:basic membrane protein A
MRLITLVALLFGCLSLAHAADKEIKVGFVYVSPVGDAGWSHAHDQARQTIDGLPGVSTSFVEAVAEGPDSERVIQTMARKKYDLIFATSFGYMDSMLKVAGQFPDTVFMHCSGFKTAANMGNYFGRIYQPRYLSGMVAGSMTKSKVLGYVAAFPIPEVIRGINAFTLGAQAVNPEVTVRVVWTNSRFWMWGPMSSPSIRILPAHRKRRRKRGCSPLVTIPT